jgi:hypothetical protein
MALPDLTTASRKGLIGEWRRVFKCREPEKAGAKVLRTCLQVQLGRQGNIQACNKAHAKLMSRLKRHEGWQWCFNAPDKPLARHRAYAKLSWADIYCTGSRCWL